MSVRIQQRVRTLSAALVPAGTALALFTMSPMGAELAMADEPKRGPGLLGQHPRRHDVQRLAGGR